MRDDLAALLRCPHCAGGLAPVAGALRCPAGHSFDLARQGYVSLYPADVRPSSADTPEMVAAREAFLNSGHYAELERAITERCLRALDGVEGCVLDIGAGTGYYLAPILDAAPDRLGVALDSAKPALRRAARAHERIAAVACDAWGSLPLRDGAAAVALSVFSPRGSREIERVLAPGGTLLTAVPSPRHLEELVGPLGLLSVDELKRERLEHKLRRLEPVDESICERRLSLSREDVGLLVAMGPSAHHADPELLAQRIAALPDPQGVTLSVSLLAHRRLYLR